MAKRATKTVPPAPSGPEFIECDQGGDEWRMARLGLVTASNFATAMASGRGDDESITRTKLMYRLAGEIITGEPAEETYKSLAMQRGNAIEDEARESFARRRNLVTRRIGFIRNFDGLKCCGCSPDSLIGFSSGLELKSARADILIPMLDNPARMPPAHRAQVHGNMWVSERDDWWLSIYCHRNMPALDIQVGRDERFIKEISDAVERFNYELMKLVDRIKRMGSAG